MNGLTLKLCTPNAMKEKENEGLEILVPRAHGQNYCRALRA